MSTSQCANYSAARVDRSLYTVRENSPAYAMTPTYDLSVLRDWGDAQETSEYAVLSKIPSHDIVDAAREKTTLTSTRLASSVCLEYLCLLSGCCLTSCMYDPHPRGLKLKFEGCQTPFPILVTSNKSTHIQDSRFPGFQANMRSERGSLSSSL